LGGQCGSFSRSMDRVLAGDVLRLDPGSAR
jgi:hypothetical protein